MSERHDSATLRRIVAGVPVIPVLVVEDAAQAVPLARALVAGGLPVLEVTLRTPAALAAIRAMATVPGAVVGAGTVLGARDAAAAASAGARFAVAPGATAALVAGCADAGLPLLPGAATASEAMRLLEDGFDFLKFFPAEAAGGVRALSALSGPLPGVAFCPTGGVSPANLADYLRLPTVLCAGGSWLAPADAVRAGDWARIEALARDAARAGR
jgi:2-dehydro-3-deoxyphosphogluconate aldolase/(4S)-4-hydroxy-2-oxoglutarate aldolase